MGEKPPPKPPFPVAPPKHINEHRVPMKDPPQPRHDGGDWVPPPPPPPPSPED
jgi:hypothetical protein